MPIVSSEQSTMIEALRGVAATGERFRRVRAAAAAHPAVDRTVWSKIAADGWLALLVPSERDGIGGTAGDLVALCDGIGDTLAPEPIAESAIVAALLAGCGTPAADALSAQVLAGSATVLLARRASFPLDGSPTHVVGDAAWATQILWSDEGEPFRLQLSESVEFSSRPLRRTTDGASALFFAPESSARDVAGGPAAKKAYDDAQDLMRLAAAATLGGIARAALAQTTAYLRTRQQFGVPLGTFQAIQHALATCHVGNIAARALCFEAARAFGGARQTAAALMAKAQASTAAMASVKASVQYHGAIGFCDETDVALFFRRVQTLSAAWGTPSQCLEALRYASGAERF